MNTKLIKYFTVTLLFLFSFATTWAQTQNNVNSNVNGGNRLFGSGLWYNLHDSATGPDDIKVDQSIWGGMVGYELSNRMETYFLLRGMWSGGSGNLKNTGSNDIHFFSHPWFVQGRLGYQLGFGETEKFGVTPYVGYMYYSNKTGVKNVHFDDESDSTTGLQSKIDQQSVSVGVVFDWMITSEFQIGLDVEALYGVSGKVNGSVDDDDPTGDTLSAKSKLKNSLNWSFELPITWQFDATWDFTFVPFCILAKYKFKNPENTIYDDDKMKADAAGVRLELGFRF